MGCSATISVIMPMYNVGRIARYSIRAVELTLSRYFDPIHFEVIAVDDGSTDDTYTHAVNEARKYANAKVIKLPRNYGKAVALFIGFTHSKGSYVVFFDGDLDIDPRQILFLLAALHKSRSDIAITSKWHPRSRIVASPIRKLLSKGFNLLERALLGIKLRDTQTGAKAFRRYVLRDLMKLLYVKRYAFDAELLAYAIRKGYRVVEVPALGTIRLVSRFSMREILSMFLDLVAVAYRLRLGGTDHPFVK